MEGKAWINNAGISIQCISIYDAQICPYEAFASLALPTLPPLPIDQVDRIALFHAVPSSLPGA
jgi:hypothetical protein